MQQQFREVPMKALTSSLVAGAALCGVVSTPASAMPISNLAAAASDFAVGQSVRYVCNGYRSYGYAAYYGYYAVLRSEPGFYRRPYYGYYRGY
jgi:hypothetical protein